MKQRVFLEFQVIFDKMYIFCFFHFLMSVDDGNFILQSSVILMLMSFGGKF